MKNTTKKKVVGALSAGLKVTTLGLGTAILAASCTEYVEVVKPDPTLIYRAESKPITFGNKGSVRIEGTLTATEWNGVPEKVRAALEAAYNKATDTMSFITVFSRTGVVINVTKGLPSDKTYNAQNSATLYLNLNELDSSDISDKIIEAVTKMNGAPLPSLGQVKKQNRVRFGGGMSPFELAQVKKHGYVRS